MQQKCPCVAAAHGRSRALGNCAFTEDSHRHTLCHTCGRPREDFPPCCGVLLQQPSANASLHGRAHLDTLVSRFEARSGPTCEAAHTLAPVHGALSDGGRPRGSARGLATISSWGPSFSVRTPEVGFVQSVCFAPRSAGPSSAAASRGVRGHVCARGARGRAGASVTSPASASGPTSSRGWPPRPEESGFNPQTGVRGLPTNERPQFVDFETQAADSARLASQWRESA